MTSGPIPSPGSTATLNGLAWVQIERRAAAIRPARDSIGARFHASTWRKRGGALQSAARRAVRAVGELCPITSAGAMDSIKRVYSNNKRTIREIKNKVYNYSEMEQMVREATCNDASEPQARRCGTGSAPFRL